MFHEQQREQQRPQQQVARQPPRKERTRRALLDSALSLFAERSVPSVPLREVARGADLSPSAFYRHFDGLDELALVLVDEAFRVVDELLARVREEMTLAAEPLDAGLRALAGGVRAEQARFRFLVRERCGADSSIRRAIGEELTRLTGDLMIDLARSRTGGGRSTEELRAIAALVLVVLISTIEDTVQTTNAGSPTNDRPIRAARQQLQLIIAPRDRADGTD